MKKMVLLLMVTIASTSIFAQSNVAQLKAELKKYKDADALVEKYLIKFDTLDFTVFTNQDWKRLNESHAKDIKVYLPDGHMTQWIEVHITNLSQLFVYAPDTRIQQHPIRIGSGNITSVTGVFEGTYTKPMPIGGGKFIQPTGKKFSMPMATIGIWKDGVMIEEHLFWDNKTFIYQIGLVIK